MIQQTVKRRILLEGIGLQTGERQKIAINPERENYGIRFEVHSYNIPAHFDYVISTTPSVTLGLCDSIRVRTVEHLLSVLSGLHIHNARIEVYGDEVPEDTGNFAVSLYSEVKKQKQPSCLYGFQSTTYLSGDSRIQTFPSDTLQINCLYRPKYLPNVKEIYDVEVFPENYMHNIRWARTFCTGEYLKKIKFKGYARGVNLHNCIVINNGSTTWKSNELVRHKILDFIGDLSTIGLPVTGFFLLNNPSHEVTYEYLRHLFRRTKNDSNNESKRCNYSPSSNEKGSNSGEELSDCRYCEI
jgi:UDP-3-O-[3-hydroxymyristoyl] N-acetylglucosamine deacetylase